MRVPHLGGMDLAQRNIHFGIGHARAKAVALPNKMLELRAAIDTVGAQKERRAAHLATS